VSEELRVGRSGSRKLLLELQAQREGALVPEPRNWGRCKHSRGCTVGAGPTSAGRDPLRTLGHCLGCCLRAERDGERETDTLVSPPPLLPGFPTE